MQAQITKKTNIIQASYIIWHKHMRKFINNGEEMFGLMIQPILWVVLFGIGMRGFISETGDMGNTNYIGFMLPGIIALSAMGGAIGGGMVWLDEHTRGIVKGYLVAPIPRVSIILGNISSTLTKSLFQGFIILFVGILMGAKISTNPLMWGMAFVFIVCYSFGFSGIALAIASKSNDLMAYHAMIMLLNLPVLFLSNALYPINSMPNWMQVAVKLNPTTYLVDGIRQTLLNTHTQETFSIPIDLLVTGAFAIFMLTFAVKTIYSKTKRS